MSEDDGFSDSFDEPSMEIQIDTLMGTTFDMRVSSTDTIREIKQRIQRVEGIPSHQQNLIYQSKELKDSRRLCDVGIKNGSIIKLVITMRGGPISTRRLSVGCEHHLMLKELKELLESTRDEIGDKLTPGSKVSVLVFKEGDIINLLRVVENEDGSYSPYSEKPISPPVKIKNKDQQMALFEKLAEDTEMMTKIMNLRKKMEDANVRKQLRNNNQQQHERDEEIIVNKKTGTGKKNLSYKLLVECNTNESLDLKVFDKLEDTDEEIALKDKHRIKSNRLQQKNMKSLYSENRGAYSHTKQNYARIHKKITRDLFGVATTTTGTGGEAVGAAASTSKSSKEETVLEEKATAKTVHLTRLVLSTAETTTERPKTTPELDENAQDLWEIHEPTTASERLMKHHHHHHHHSATTAAAASAATTTTTSSTTCLLKRRQSLDYGYEGLENNSKEVGSGYCKNSEYEVCSGNLFHLPQFVSTTPSAIPPQYAPKNQDMCDYYFNSRSPLYGRKSRNDETIPNLPEINNNNTNNFLSGSSGGCSNIQRLKNDCGNNNNHHHNNNNNNSGSDEQSNIDELYGYYNLSCAATELLGEKVIDLIDDTNPHNHHHHHRHQQHVLLKKQQPVDDDDEEEEEEEVELPPVIIKKKARCHQCNKRLNITNIYNCRCGKIFCSQHRYSEVHHCNYDYKSEGRRILEHQNPLVTADKINRI